MIPSCVVSVSLRSYIHSYLLWILRGTKAQEEFPSPYRVSFILIICGRYLFVYWFSWVSVSLQSIIHSYKTFKIVLMNFGRLRVSVSLRSYIHSYVLVSVGRIVYDVVSVSVSLRSYIHSYSTLTQNTYTKLWEILFPSPYGVSFILILQNTNVKKCQVIDKFPSPYGVSFILIEAVEQQEKEVKVKLPSPYGVIFILTWWLFIRWIFVW